jgi:transposase-like protein
LINPYKEIQRLQKINERQAKIIEHQAKIITELQAKIDKLEHPKNSRNSSIPPSQDYTSATRTKSLREPSGRKPGGQTGHEGTTLQMTETPDQIIKYIPQYCNCCGLEIDHLPAELVECRQEVRLPVIRPEYIEHQVFQRYCTCGHKVIAEFPAGVTPGISYSSNIDDMASYLSVRQFLPFRRMSELFRDVFNIPISEGALTNSIRRITQKALQRYENIRIQAENSDVVGGDETGTKINGKKGWFWTIQGKFFTYIIASYNRGRKTIDDHFPKGFPKSIMVHDCWKSYFGIRAMAHQICTAHLLRELNHIIEFYTLKWAVDLKQLLTESIEWKKTLKEDDYLEPLSQWTEFEERLTRLLDTPIDKRYPLAISFQKRLVKYKEHIFTFLYVPYVTPDNNGSERAIRNVKVKHKVSGFFKSYNGAQSFAVIRSIIDTAIKNKTNPIYALSKVNS